MSVRSLARSLLSALFAVLAIGGGARAQAQAEEGWGYELSDELMSPWCPGFSLPDCSSGYASDLRLWILEQERLGRSRGEVKAEILARYGDAMLQAPEAKGRGWLAYAIPAAIVLAGFAVLVTFLRNQVAAAPALGARNPGPTALARGGPSPGAMAQVDAELAGSGSAND
jgi:cytochrome c-type biogenesis protein CcmH/NrfF